MENLSARVQVQREVMIRMMLQMIQDRGGFSLDAPRMVERVKDHLPVFREVADMIADELLGKDG